MGAKLANEECVWPFIDSDGSGPYHHCTTNRDEHGQCWCSFDRHYVSGTGRWRYCNEMEHKRDQRKVPKNNDDRKHLKEMKKRQNEYATTVHRRHIFKNKVSGKIKYGRERRNIKNILLHKKKENMAKKRKYRRGKRHQLFSNAMPSFWRGYDAAYRNFKRLEDGTSKLLSLPSDQQYKIMIHNVPKPDHI